MWATRICDMRLDGACPVLSLRKVDGQLKLQYSPEYLVSKYEVSTE